MSRLITESIMELIKGYSPLANQGIRRNDIPGINKLWYYLLSNLILESKPYPLTEKVSDNLIKTLSKEKALLDLLGINTHNRFSGILLYGDSIGLSYSKILEDLGHYKHNLAAHVSIEGHLNKHEALVYNNYISYLTCLIKMITFQKEVDNEQ